MALLASRAATTDEVKVSIAATRVAASVPRWARPVPPSSAYPSRSFATVSVASPRRRFAAQAATPARAPVAVPMGCVPLMPAHHRWSVRTEPPAVRGSSAAPARPAVRATSVVPRVNPAPESRSARPPVPTEVSAAPVPCVVLGATATTFVAAPIAAQIFRVRPPNLGAKPRMLAR